MAIDSTLALVALYLPANHSQDRGRCGDDARSPQASLLWEHCFELHTFSFGSLRLQFGCALVQKLFQNFRHQEKSQNVGQAEASHVSLHAMAKQRKRTNQIR
ncbi:unnamed protein product [Pieris macdunnoughi]|uniref:Uncharacterized protein n=1 Tax=Pieris macdunnoughi TaxID=345717 RepID=A0A821WW01_9NEOP|nr:unnamed protein product [Pieris macdunnoughi]